MLQTMMSSLGDIGKHGVPLLEQEASNWVLWAGLLMSDVTTKEVTLRIQCPVLNISSMSAFDFS